MMLSTLNIEQVHAGWDTVENKVAIGLRVGGERAVVECYACGVEGGGWVGEAETALDGSGGWQQR